MTDTVNFKTFLAVWNRGQGQDTPRIHFRMAEWLQGAWDAGARRLLLQAFRSSGKSTIAGLFAAWVLYRRDDFRILVLAADLMLARKMVRNVRRIIERHPLTAHLKPARADQWGADRFTVARAMELRDPSMLARGITANITGSRADIIICDDVEVPNTSDTVQKRAELRERLGEINFVLAPGGMILYIGTPHTWYTIYADEPRTEQDETEAFLAGFDRLSIPVLDAAGQSAWPEKFTAGDIDRMRRSSGPNKFSSQMMLTPVNAAEGRLNAGALRWYNDALFYSKELDRLFIGGTQVISCGAWWDPSGGKAGNDESVFAVVFTDAEGERYLHRIEYVRPDPFDAKPNAEQQARKVALAAQMLYVPAVTVETNGVGHLMPDMLRREIGRINSGCAVRETHSRRAKDDRIIESFDALLAARMLHVHDGVRKTPFLTEMMEWRPGISGQRDDGLDAAAGALSLNPARLRYDGNARRHSWHRGGKKHTAKTIMDE